MRLAPVLLVLLLALTACGEKSEPIGALPAFPQHTADALNREVVAEKAPKRVVSLDPGITEAAFQYGAGNQLVGGTGTETYPPPATHLRPMLDGEGHLDVQALQRARPDLVLAPIDLVPTKAAADALALKLSSDVYVTDDQSVQGIEHDILATGLLMGHADGARGIFNEMQRRISTITHPFAGQDPVPVFVDRGYFYSIPGDGLAADLIRLAGGRNVAASADPAKPFGPAQLAAAAPQVYLAVAASGVTLEGLRRSKATKNLPAIRDKRFAIVPDAVLSRSGPRVVDSLETLVGDIHPDVASGQGK